MTFLETLKEFAAAAGHEVAVLRTDTVELFEKTVSGTKSVYEDTTRGCKEIVESFSRGYQNKDSVDTVK